jgi:hypothetical protein
MVHPAQLMEECKLLWMLRSAVATMVESIVLMKMAIATMPKISQRGGVAPISDLSEPVVKYGFKVRP